MLRRFQVVSQRLSPHTFISDTATTLSAPLASTTASCAASASNLLGAVSKGSPVSSATAEAKRSAKPFFVFRPVPTAVPPCVARRQSLLLQV